MQTRLLLILGFLYLNISQLYSQSNNENNGSETARALADLIVENPDAEPTTVAAGDFIDLSCVVKNQGGASTGSGFGFKYYLSTNETFGAGDGDIDLLENPIFVSDLDAQESFNLNTTGVEIPENTTLGTYYIVFFADSEFNISESSENNNSNFKKIIVTGSCLDELEGSEGNNIPENAFDIGTATFYENENLCIPDESDQDWFTFTHNNTPFFFKIIETPQYQGFGLGPYKINFSRSGNDVTIFTSPTAGIVDTYLEFYGPDHTTLLDFDEDGQGEPWFSQVDYTINDPDLTITDTGISPSSLVDGAITTANFKLKNDASSENAFAGASKVGLYLSSNDTYGASDVLLSEIAISEYLNSGVSTEVFFEDITIPEGTESGTYYILIRADIEENLSETNEDNNLVALEINIVSCGDPLEVNNQFQQAIFITDGTTHDDICLIPQDEDWFKFDYNSETYFFNIRGADTSVEGDYNLTFSLSGDEVVIETSSRAGSTTDTYIELYNTDGESLLAEDDNSGTDANFSKITYSLESPLPDLTALHINLGGPSAQPGAEFTINYTIKNIGTVSAGTSKAGYYLSTNESFESGIDVLLGDFTDISSLDAGDSTIQDITRTIPEGTAFDTYYVLVVADDDGNEVVESDETNNWIATQINVVDCDPFDPNNSIEQAFDLGEDNLPVTETCFSDENDEDNFKFLYFGNYYYFKVQYPLIFETPPNNNPYNIQFTRNGNEITIETSDAGGSDFGVHLTLYDTDGTSIITEVTNFQWNTQINETLPDPLSDLIIDGQSVTPTEDIEPGTTISANCTIKNRGQGNAPASKVGFYLHALAGGVDILLEEKDVIALGPEDTDDVFNVSLVIPEDSPAGEYTIIFKADDDNNIDEDNEDNNIVSEAITIIESNCEDPLEPNNYASEANSDIGGSAAYSFNNLCLTSNDHDWFSFIYSNKTYYFKVRGESSQTSGTYSLAFNRSGNTVTIQTLTADGSSTDTYLELYDTDTTTLIAENDDGGNAPFSILIEDLTIPQPDLAPLNPDNITAVKTGEEVTFSVDVKNIAEVSSEVESTVGFYLSTDVIFDAETDLNLGEVNVAALNAGQSLNKSVTVNIPFETTPGNYHLIYVVDLNDDIEEDNENNNILTKEIAVTLSTIEIITPNGGESLTVGNSQLILWNTDTDGDVKIELLQSDAILEVISDNTPNDGQFTWNVFNELNGVFSDFKIRITSLEDENVKDESNNTFTIEPNIITVTAPNGGEEIQAGQLFTIEWNSLLSVNAKIELYKDGIFLQDIATTTENDGSFEWTTPISLPIADDYKVKITTIDDVLTRSDLSNENFSITPPPVNPADSLALISLYNSTNGLNWTTVWDLEDNLRNWNGVTLTADRVTGIDLQNQNLNGTIPVDLENIEFLENLNLAENQLTGSVPTEITNITALEDVIFSQNQLTSIPTFSNNLPYLNVSDNQLKFAVLIPNEAINDNGGTFLYSPQTKIDDEINETIIGGENYTMQVSELTTGNTFQWKKDDSEITNATLSSFTLSNFQESEAGTYTCLISNPGAPDLVLERNAIIITHQNASPNDISLSKIIVEENLPVGTEVAVISTTDPDLSDLHTYELVDGAGDTDNASFEINESNLLSLEVFDFEEKTAYSIRLKSTDEDGESFEKTFTITISDENDNPIVINAIDNQQATEDIEYSFTFNADVFEDEDAGDVLSYTASLSDDSALPSWLSFDNDTRTFSGTPLNENVGIITIKVIATDIVGASVTDEFELEVINTNDVPTLENAIADQSANEDEEFSFSFAENTFNDVDAGDVLTYTASLSDDSELPSWLSFTGETRTFSGTPTQDELGTISIKITATDNSEEFVTDEFDLEVINTNDAPTVINPIADLQATEDVLFEYTFNINVFDDIDPDDALTYSSTLSDNSALPNWLSFDADSRTFSGAPENDHVGILSISLIATDIAGANVTDEFELEIINTNDAPTLENPIADFSTNEDELLNFVFDENTFNDIDVGDEFSYTATLTDETELPDWLTFDSDTRTFSGTPTNDEIGSISIKLTASDLSGESVSDEFELEVINTNDSPIVVNPISNQEATEDLAFEFTFNVEVFDDVDPGDALTFSSTLSDDSDLPSWLSFNTDERTFSGTPENDHVGTITIKVLATDIAGASVADEFDLEIINTNDIPTLENPIADFSTNEDELLDFTFNENTFNDIDLGDELSYIATLSDDSELPSWLSFNSDTRTFSGTPTNDEIGSISIKIVASDISGETVEDEFVLEVVNTNDIPIVVNPISDQEATEDIAFEFTFNLDVFDDIDPGDALTYSSTLSDNSELPSWLSFDAESRTFSGTPENENVGTTSIKVIATDIAGASISDEFDITIINTNDAPTLENPIADFTTNEDELLSFTFAENTFDDIDVGDVLSYSATLSDESVLPAWLSFDADTRTFSGTPTNDEIGSISIKLTASDLSGESVSDEFSLEVLNTNDDPTIANPMANQEATEDNLFEFTFSENVFADVDPDDVLTYTATLSDDSELPSWLSFNADTRTFSGTPENENVGTITIKAIATDITGADVSDEFEVTVINTNDAPIVSNPISDQNTNEDAIYNFTFAENTFNDVDAGDALTYLASLADDSELPSWLSFDAENRTFTGTPLNEHVGIINIKVTAYDLAGTNISDEFSLEILNTNDIPTLENPIANQTVTEDLLYSFTFVANTFGDIDIGDEISYTASLADDSELPSWLSFDAENRTLSGTPLNDHVGVISIKITATDIEGANVSDEFDIAVINTNDIPEISIPIADQQATEDLEFIFTFNEETFRDVDLGDELTYIATLSDGSELPSWLSFNAESRTFNGIPENDQVGTISVKVIASDLAGTNVSDEFDLEIINTNDAPTLVYSIISISATEDALMNYTFNEDMFADVDAGDVFTYTASLEDGSNLPSWINFDAENKTFSGTPENDHVGTINIKLTATDIAGESVSDIFEIQISNSNDAPLVLNPVNDQSTNEDDLYEFTIENNVFGDIDLGDELSYTASLSDDSSLPEWLSFDIDSKTFTGTPLNDHVGTIIIKVTATDLEGASVSDEYELEIINTNDAPKFTSVIVLGALQNALYTYNVTATDVDQNAILTLSANSIPSWLSFTDNGNGVGVLTGTPSNDEVGTHEVVLALSDGIAEDVLQSFTITVVNSNDAPEFTSIAITVATEDELYEYNITANDIDGNASLTISSSAIPEWLNLTDLGDGKAILTGTAENKHVGSHEISLALNDGIADEVYQNFTLTVTNTNDAPILENPIANQSTNEDELFEFTFNENTFSDIDLGDELSYSASLDNNADLPEWLNFDSASRTFSGTPDNSNVGTITIIVTAEDTGGETTTDEFAVEVINTNDAPIAFIPIDDQEATEDAVFEFTLDEETFLEIDADDFLTYTASLNDNTELPEWLTFVGATLTFSGTPENEDVGTLGVKVIATDSHGLYTVSEFNIEVINTNDAPIIIAPISDLITLEDDVFNYKIENGVFTDEDEGDELTFAASLSLGEPLPEWLSFDPNTRTFSGTPKNEDVGTITIKVTVTDQSGATVTEIFNLEVMNSNDAPEFTSVPILGVLQETLYSYVISSNDVDLGAVISINASTLPSWLSFTDNHNGTALLSGTPSNSEVGEHAVVLNLSDGIVEDITQSFIITVVNSNDAPHFISSASLEINEDENYVYNIAAEDVDGNQSLTISSSTLPDWLDLSDQGNGLAVLSGIPLNNEVGTHEVTLELNDGIAETVKQTFIITVINVNDAPLVSNAIQDQDATEDLEFTFTFPENTFIDIDEGDELSYNATIEGSSDELPSWLSFSPENRTFSGTPDNEFVGIENIAVTATDNSGAFITTILTINVINTNDSPYLSSPITDQTINEDEVYSFTFDINTFGDDDLSVNDDEVLSYSASLADGSNLPEWLSFNSDIRAFWGIPENDHVGNLSIKLTVSDSEGEQAIDEFDLIIQNVNDAPQVVNQISNVSTQENALFNYFIGENVFLDIDTGDELLFMATLSNDENLPLWLSFDAVNKVFNGTPSDQDVGTYNIKVSASDLSAASVSTEFTIEVLPNNPPLVSSPIGDQVVAEDISFLFQFPFNTFTDIDEHDELTYHAKLESGQDLPGWLSFNPENRSFEGTPTNDEVGVYSIEVIATDKSSDFVSDIFIIEVVNINDAPVYTSLDISQTNEDELYTYIVTYIDVDNSNEELSVAASTIPAWLSLTDNKDGSSLLTGTPGNGDVGEHQVVLELNDGDITVTKEFSITVFNVNDAPVLNEIVVGEFCPQNSIVLDLRDYTVDVDNDIDTEITYAVSGNNVINGFEYFIDGNNLILTHEGAESSSFNINVFAEDPSGAVASQKISIVTYYLEASIFNEDNILIATEGEAYQWYKDGDIINGATERSFEIEETGDYQVAVTYADGKCIATSPLRNIAFVVSFNVSVFPNPSSDFISVELNTLEGSEVFIINSNGLLIAPDIVSENKINISMLPRGVYLLRIINEKGKKAVTRFLKN